MSRRNSIRSVNVRRALGIYDPHEHAANRVADMLRSGHAVDSRRRDDGTWTHRKACIGRNTGDPS